MRYKIEIPKPCSENWSIMTPTEKGAFCSTCQKEVLNFTNKSNNELSKFVFKNKNICGKFKPSQLGINNSSVETNRYSKYRFLLGLSTFLSLTTPLLSQNKSLENKEITEFNQTKKRDKIIEKVTDSIQIKGVISDINGGLPGVNISFNGNYSDGTQTDFDGNFSINIDREKFSKNATLVISFLGYKRQEIKINQKTLFLKVVMEEDDDFLLGEVVIIKKQNIFRRIGNLFRKKD